MNGDTVSQILEYLENEGADLPKEVNNSMLLIASREQYRTTKFFFDEAEKHIGKLAKTLADQGEKIIELDNSQKICQARLKAESDVKKEQEEKKDKRFGRVGMLLTFLNDNALVTFLLTALGTYIAALLMGG